MRKTQTRMITLITILALVMGLIVALPASAGAATGMATINVGTLGATDMNNSASVATESQWYYTAAVKTLYLTMADGNYTLTGTNADLQVVIGGSSIVVLDNVSIIAHGTAMYAIWCTNGTITLVGTNTLSNSSGTALYVQVSCTINGNGSATLANLGSANAATLYTQPGSTLTIDGQASVTSTGRYGIYTYGDIFIGDNAQLTTTSTSQVVRTFGAVTPTSGYTWLLTGGASTSDPLTDPTITVTIPANSTSTIAREAGPVEEPSLTPTLSDATLHFLYPQIGTTRQVTVTQLLDGTTPLGDWDWEIIGNTNPAVATVVDPTSGVYDEPLTIEALAPGQTVITVKVMEFANGLTGRYGLATITVTVDGPPPTDNGGDKVPPTGEALTLLSPMMLATLSLLSICTAVIDKKRG